MSGLIGSFIFGTIVLIMCALCARKQESSATWVLGIIALVVFGLTTFLAGPFVLGQGVIPRNAEVVAKRLSEGVAYQVVSSREENDGSILLQVKRIGEPKSDRVLRVKEEDRPPELFTLIDGKPVEIVPVMPSTK